jgi:SAM-dependent methyltransferase
VDPSLYRDCFEIEEHYWWSVGMRAIAVDWLGRGLRGTHARVLDLGCGTGMLAQELGALGWVCGVDNSGEAIGYARRRGIERLCRGSAEGLPFRSASFDAVAAIDVVEHTDDGRTLSEVARVLKPAGIVLINVPAFPALWGEHDEVAQHRRRYRRAGLERLVADHGLRVERISHANCLLFPFAGIVRLGKRLVRRHLRPRPPRAEIYDVPAWLNTVLTTLLLREAKWLRRRTLPFGVSLVCLARKAGS